MDTTKSRVLYMLEKSRGEWVTGQTIAESMSVTRASVWKAVRMLREDGHGIDAYPRRGYCLRAGSDVLSAEGVRAAFKNAMFPVPVEYAETIDSTNAELRRRGELPDGFTLIANEQTAGRGRLGRRFYSPPGTGLYLSIYRKLGWEPERARLVTLAAAVAVSRAIETLTDTHTSIKWVNDIYVGERKIAGILVEGDTDYPTGTLRSAVISVGVNCATEAFPEEIAARAGSLTRPVLRVQLAAEIIRGLMSINTSTEMLDAYRSRDFLYDRHIAYERNGERFTGLAHGIGDDGSLLVRTDAGEVTLGAGEVTLSRWANEEAALKY